MPAGVEVEGARFAHQLHASFEGKLVALAAVAEMATSYKVFPSGRTSARTRNDVIKRQLAGRQYGGAILAGVAVAQQDVLARQSPALVRDAAILEQPDYRGHAHGDASRVQEVSILLFGHGH